MSTELRNSRAADATDSFVLNESISVHIASNAIEESTYRTPETYISVSYAPNDETPYSLFLKSPDASGSQLGRGVFAG